MALAFKKQVALRPGEEMLLTGSGLVRLELVSGVIEVAGVMLEAGRNYPFILRSADAPSLLVYTLEGGVVKMESERNLDMSKGPTGVGELYRLINQPWSPSEPLRLLVVGRTGVGKSHTAATLCHLIQRLRKEQGIHRRTFLVDLNPGNNALYAPGCVSSREVSDSPLWLGQTAGPTQTPLTLSFFCGTTAPPSTIEGSHAFLHFAEQCVESTTGWIEELMSPTAGASSSMENSYADHYALVMDVTSPSGQVRAVPFYKQLIQVVHPTHVIFVTDEMKPGFDNDEDEGWEEAEAEERNTTDAFAQAERAASSASLNPYRFALNCTAAAFTPRWVQTIIEDLQNSAPECRCVRIRPTQTPRVSLQPTALQTATLLRQYFIGSPSVPLGCTKVSLSTQSIQFAELRYDPDTLGVTAHASPPPRGSWARLMCSISHAEIIEEVPLAPTAGLVLLTQVDEESDEVALLIPASRHTLLPRRFIVLPTLTEINNKRDDGLMLSAAHLALMEESSVV